MREEDGIEFVVAPRIQAQAPAPSRPSAPKTTEDALTPQVAHENALAISALMGQVPGAKRA